MPHDREAAKDVDLGAVGGRGDQLDHSLRFRLGDHFGSKLRIDQQHVRSGVFDLLDALADQFADLFDRQIAQRCVSAELLDQQIGLLIDHVPPDTHEHLVGVLAVDATIENNDRYVGIKPVEFGREPGRIGRIGRARAGARRRR